MALTKDDEDKLFNIKHEINESKCDELSKLYTEVEKNLRQEFGADFQILGTAHFECWIKEERVGIVLTGLKKGKVIEHHYVDVRGLGK